MKKNLLLLSLLSLSTIASADEMFINDLVVKANETTKVTVYLTLDNGMVNNATECMIAIPSGLTVSNAAMGDDIQNNSKGATAMIKGAKVELNSFWTNLGAGTYVYATFDVTASESVGNTTLKISDIIIGDEDGEDAVITAEAIKDITISPVGYSTYSACAAVKVTGATVYTGAINGNVLQITEVADGIVPANTGVLLGGEAGATVTLAPSEDEGGVSANDLVSSKDAKELSSILALGGDEDGKPFFGSYSVANIQPNKAYLPASAAGAPIRIDFGGNSIESVNAESVEFNYNLMGQQVKAGKGVMISNGKKTLQK